MNGRDKKNEKSLTLVEAVETLSSIADLKIDHFPEMKDEPTPTGESDNRTIHWLHYKEASETINIVKETFCTILKYLKEFYKDKTDISSVHTIEGIKTVMVLASEAAKKLDRCTDVFFKNKKDSVTELKEYKKLQEFYSNHIAKQIDERKLGEWIFALSRKKIFPDEKIRPLKAIKAKHVFMDLESAKKDTEYELFLLKKEDGTRFYSPRLVRNIKLISDFESYLKGEHETDPLLNISVTESKYACHVANILIKELKESVGDFLSLQGDNRFIVEALNKAIIALFMAANNQNILHVDALKDCHSYLKDFQFFLRKCLESAEYQKMLAYPPPLDDVYSHTLLKIIRGLCKTIYSGLVWPREFTGMLQGLLQESENSQILDLRKTTSLTARLTKEYAALSKYIKQHPNSAMNKVVSLLEDNASSVFDPLMQDNLPTILYGLYVQDKVFPIARWPSVTVQNFIDKAVLNEEFKAYIEDYKDQNKKVLLINFQDRVSWKEQARSEAIESLMHHQTDVIDIVTITKDTEFYQQQAPYLQDNQADVFIENFIKELKAHESGYFFSKHIKSALGDFNVECLEEIHKIFFLKKNILTRDNRLVFIELFYLFLTLKIIDICKPDMIGLSCKDGLDVTSTAAAEFYIFMKSIRQEVISENDQEFIDSMLYSPCLITRGRVLNGERFNRMINTLKEIESVRAEFGQDAFLKIIEQGFQRFYTLPLLKGKVYNIT